MEDSGAVAAEAGSGVTLLALNVSTEIGVRGFGSRGVGPGEDRLVRGAIGVDRYDVGDHAGVEPDAKPRRDFLAFGRVVKEHCAGARCCGGGREVGRLGRHEVVVQVRGGGLEDRGDAILGECGRDCRVHVTVDGDGGFTQGTAHGQQFQAALLQGVSGVVNEYKYVCHVCDPS